MTHHVSQPMKQGWNKISVNVVSRHAKWQCAKLFQHGLMYCVISCLIQSLLTIQNCSTNFYQLGSLKIKSRTVNYYQIAYFVNLSSICWYYSTLSYNTSLSVHNYCLQFAGSKQFISHFLSTILSKGNENHTECLRVLCGLEVVA